MSNIELDDTDECTCDEQVCDECSDHGINIDGRQWMAQAMISVFPVCCKDNLSPAEAAKVAADLVEAGWFALRDKLDEWDAEDESVKNNGVD